MAALAESKVLEKEEIGRYGRQLILPEWGVEGQLKMKSASVLIVGAGGLGCPSAQYLAAAGVGHLGIVDYDSVEISNLHRQILHTEGRVGVTKVSSAQESIQSLNSKVKVTPHHLVLSSINALSIIKEMSFWMQVTMWPQGGGYLLNDSCVLLKKPLVSGSALRFEGQLTVYNYKGGPCYRCLFPSPPPPHCVTNCSEGGVVGVVPGVIGSLQALEAMKIITHIGDPMFSKLLLFDGFSGTFRHIKLRERNPECSVCGDDPTIKELIDYEQFCGSKPNDKERQKELLSDNQRISCADYKTLVDEGVPHLLLDVREPVEYDICHLPHSHNIPLSQLQKSKDVLSLLNILLSDDNKKVFIICRRGNDSQVAVQLLEEVVAQSESNLQLSVSDINGGLTEWSNSIDKNFPLY